MRGSNALALIAAGFLACADPPRSTGLEETISADGLYRVPSRRVGSSYVRPGASLQGYSKVRVELTAIEYERPPTSARSGPSGATANYALTSKQRTRIERYFRESFERELSAKGGFAVVSTPGADVLDVRARIVDLVVQVPPEPRASDRSFVRRVGELTLIVDVNDSLTGESLVRLADRRVISQSADFQLYRSDSVTHTAELRKAFSRWARLLRERLEALRDLAVIPTP